MTKPTIAVAMIVRDEEVLLARCLESVKNADAIYILDTGSTDKTIEIAKKYTDNVFIDFIWVDAFDLAQNHIKSKVKEDFILSIDADEVCQDFSEVRKAIEAASEDCKSIRCNMMAEGSTRLEFGFSRLFRNIPEIFWVQPIHKHLNIPGEGDHIGNVNITFGWSPAHKNDPDRALRILEKVVSEEPEPSRNLYYLGREYWYKQKYKECIDTLGRYVKIATWPAEKAEAWMIMSMAYSTQGLDEEARDACLQAIKINSNFKEAIEFMSGIVPEHNSKQWKRMAKTANNKDVLWDRVPAEPIRDIIWLSPHFDDESLFGAYTLMRLRPLVIVVTDAHIQYERGDTGCSNDIRRKETIEAMSLLKCPVLFMGIKDTELTEEVLRERLSLLNPETIYVPDVQGGNPQHDLIGKVCLELFGNKCERYTTYTKSELYTVGNYEIVPTQSEIDLKNKALDCYKSQLALPSTLPHFEAVRGRSEWLM